VTTTNSETTRQGQPSTLINNISDTQSELVLSCLAIFEERRKGNLSFTHASLQLVELLPNDNARIEAYATYLNQLTKFDHECSTAASQGRATNDALVAEIPCPILNQVPNSAPATTIDSGVPSILKYSSDHLHA